MSLHICLEDSRHSLFHLEMWHSGSKNRCLLSPGVHIVTVFRWPFVPATGAQRMLHWVIWRQMQEPQATSSVVNHNLEMRCSTCGYNMLTLTHLRTVIISNENSKSWSPHPCADGRSAQVLRPKIRFWSSAAKTTLQLSAKQLRLNVIQVSWNLDISNCFDKNLFTPSTFELLHPLAFSLAASVKIAA